MAISIFPSTAAEFVSNNFVVDMNDTTNNTADTGGIKQAGPYSLSFSSGDTSFDVYFIDEDGNSVGYSNSTSITATGLFSTVVILGVAQDEIISFQYQGSVNNADGEGDEPGAGAYLESITPSDLPGIDDTATVTGGNFGANTEITFESGATVLSAKNIVVTNSTELVVTRPDALIEDDAPYTVRAKTTGVPEPTGTNANILTDAVTAGSDPTWVTTSPLNAAPPGQAFSQTLEATDSDGTVTDYSVTAGTLTPGLTLNSSTGVLSGTPTTAGNFTFTVTATDDGGNTTAKEFEQLSSKLEGGTFSEDGTFAYHTFLSSDDLIVPADLSVEYLAVAGGGGGGSAADFTGGGGGGAGGLLTGSSTLTAGTITITVGAGGAIANDGSDTVFTGVATCVGGGAGATGIRFNATDGSDGGSGGGATNGGTAGTGTAGQGFAGGTSNGGARAGGGGGASEVGADTLNNSDGGEGGDGIQLTAYATASGVNVDGGYFAGGGGAGRGGVDASGVPGSAGGLGGGGRGSHAFVGDTAITGTANTGGGGGGGSDFETNPFAAAAGGSGILVVRYAL